MTARAQISAESGKKPLVVAYLSDAAHRQEEAHALPRDPSLPEYRLYRSLIERMRAFHPLKLEGKLKRTPLPL